MQPVSIFNAEHYLWGEGCDGWHLLKRDDVSIIQERVPAGKNEVKHYHNVSRQFFYILSGSGMMLMDDGQVSLSRGEGVEIPPGTAHEFRNDSNDEVVFLVISVPKSHGDRINLNG